MIDESLQRRKKTLLALAHYILEKESDFLSATKEDFIPLNMQICAQELNLHISTLSRALSQKYFHCPRGLFSFHHFFTRHSHTLEECLVEVIHNENKADPLTDEHLCSHLKSRDLRVLEGLFLNTALVCASHLRHCGKNGAM